MADQKSGRRKKPRLFNILVVIAILLVAVCFILSASGRQSDFIKNYSTNFKNNISAIAQKFNISLPDKLNGNLQNTPEPEPENGAELNTPEPGVSATIAPKTEVTGGNVSLPKENASSAQYIRYKGMLLCADQTAFTAYDTKGNVVWSSAVQAGKPILRAEGSYILLAEKSGKKITLFKDKKQLYSTQTEDEIISASLSSAGDVVVVTEKQYYKGSVIVYNKKGSQVFVWNSGTDSILDADISAGGRRLAVSLLSTEEAVKSVISFFDITKTESDASAVYENCVIFDVEFSGETLNAIADDKTVGINANGKEQWKAEYGGKVLNHYKIEENGNKLFAYDNQNVSSLELLNASGKTTKTLKAELIPDFVDIYSGYCAYNSGRDVMFGKISGKDLKKYACPKDVKNIVILDNTTVAVICGGSIEFIDMQQG